MDGAASIRRKTYPLAASDAGPGEDGFGGGGGPHAAVLDAGGSKGWQVACHLSGLAGLLGPGILSVVGPLVVWLVRRGDDPSIEPHGRAAINFHLSMLLVVAAAAIFAFVTFGFGLVIAVPVFILVFVAEIVCSVVAAIRASEGRPYRYPFSIAFLSPNP